MFTKKKEKHNCLNSITIIFLVSIASLLLMAADANSNNSIIASTAQAQTSDNEGDDGDENNDPFKVIVRVDGIDYSIGAVKIWISANGVTESKTLNAKTLLNSINSGKEEDDDGAPIQIQFEFEKGVVKVGDQFSACIQILEDSDKVGYRDGQVLCKTGINTSGRQAEIINISL